MRVVCQAAAAAVLLSYVGSLQAFGQGTAGLSITNYQFVSEQRFSRNQSYITYRADLVNTGAARSAVTATVSSTVSSVQTVPGQTNLHFSPVPAGGHVTSSNTFTIFVDRSVNFDFSQLSWSFLAPFANAGPNQTAAIGTTVTLNGTGSTNPSGQGQLSYNWNFILRPPGTSTRMFGSDTLQPTFLVDAPGDYVIQLTVNNGLGTDTSIVTVTTNNSAPVASPGANQTVALGSTVVLNGGGSSDVDGNPLTYLWAIISAPAGSNASLTNATAVSPTFVADKAGSYIVQLTVNDGTVNSAPATVKITTLNTAPVAQPGANQVVNVLSLVQLNGSASSDVDGDPLTFHWSFNSTPAGSTATLSSLTTVNPTFTADKQGTYVVQLIVNDGQANSQPVTVSITTNTVQAPTAIPGAGQTVQHGATVTLNGSGTDPQSLPLTLLWSLTTKPVGSTAALTAPTTAHPTFVADFPGTYIAQLIVNNGYANSAPATVTITTTNTTPVAAAGSAQSVGVGNVVQLDGSGSSDADSDPITYHWSLTTIPAGSSAVLSAATSKTPTFVADAAGTFIAQLIVNDGFTNSPPSTVTITAGVRTITLTPSPLNMGINSTALVTVTLGSPAGVNGLVVSLSSNTPSIASVPASVTVPGGSTGANVTVTTTANTGSAMILATSSGYSNGSTQVNVAVPSITVGLESSVVGWTKTINGSVTLSTPAPVGGLTVSLSAPGGFVTIPSTVTVTGGTSTAAFTITGTAPGQTTITATAANYANGSANISVNKLGAIKLPVGLTVGPNATVNYPVTLLSGAPSGGVTITLQNSDPTKATLPASVFIAQGQTAPTTQPVLSGLNFGSVTITASAPGFDGDSQTSQVAATLSFTQSSIGVGAGGGTANLTLNISSPAPAGVTINLSSDNTAAATVPSTIAFPANATSITVPVTGVAQGTAIIHASSLPNLADVTATANVALFGSINMPANPSVAIGAQAQFTVSLSAAAPAGGTTINLSSTDTAKLTISPASVVVAPGATSPGTQPTITGVAIGTATINATATAYGSASKLVNINGPLTFVPGTVAVTAGQTQNVALNLPASTPTAITVTLLSDGTGTATVPATVTIPAGSSTVNVPVTGVATGTTQIHASGTNLITANATVNVSSAGPIGVSNGSVALGGTATFAVTLSSPAASAVTVNLSSSATSKVTISPASVVIPAGATAPTTQPTVSGVSVGSASITASATGYDASSATIQVTATASFNQATYTIVGLTTQNVTVNLSAVTPAALTLNLSSSATGVATIPATITIPANSSSATVQVTGVGVGSSTIHVSGTNVPDATATVNVNTVPAIILPSAATVTLGGISTFPVTLSVPAASAVQISLVSSDTSKVTISPASVTIQAGATAPTTQPTITGVNLGGANITASGGTYANVSAAVKTIATASFSPNPVNLIGVTNQNVQLALSSTSPTPVTLTLTSDDPSIASVPATVTISANSFAVNFQLAGHALGTTTIRASALPYVLESTLPVTISNSGPLTFPATSTLALGGASQFVLALPSAPLTPVTVTLSSSDSNTVSISPTTITFNAGSTTPTSQPIITALSTGSATITVAAPGYNTGTGTVNVTASLGFSPASITMGTNGSTSASVTLSAPTKNPVTVTLLSDNTGVATVPATVTIPANTAGTTFQVQGHGNGSTTLHATAPNTTAGTASVAVGTDIILPTGITVGPGAQVAFPVMLSNPAGSQGASLTLQISDPSKVSLTSTTLTFLAGSNTPTAQPNLNGLNFGAVTITATSGTLIPATTTVGVSATLSINPNPVTMLPNASPIVGIALSSSAPTALVINLTSANPGIASVPATVTIPAGQQSVLFHVTGGSGNGSTTITASTGIAQIPDTTATVAVGTNGFVTLPTTISAGLGQVVTYPVSLTVPAPVNGETITLVSNGTNLSFKQVNCLGGTPCPPLPNGYQTTTVFIPEGQTTPAQQPTITGVTAGSVSITGTAPGYGNGTGAATVTGSFAWTTPTFSITGATTKTAFLVLSGPAQVSIPLTLVSSNPGVATVPSNMQFFWDGSSPTTLQVQVTGVSSGTTVITASSPNMADELMTVNVVGPLAITTLSLPGGITNTPYSAPITAAGGQTPYAWTAASLPAGLSINPTTGTISGTPTAAGSTSVAVTVTDASSTAVTTHLTINITAALAITTSSLPGGTVGQAYPSTTMAASGGNSPYTWTATGLPAGLSISASTGLISGTPTAAGTSTATITVTDSTNPTHLTKSVDFPITVVGPINITTASLTGGVVGTPYSMTVLASGGLTPYTWSATGLPSPLTINASTGVISGTPTANGTSSVTITATDATNPTHQTSTVTLSLVISNNVTITTSTLPNGFVGTAYNQTVAAAGGTPGYTWSATGLPSPLTINASTGVISGTPTATSTSSVVITVTDSTNPTHLTATATISLTIGSNLAITPTTLPNGISGTAYSKTIAATGGTPGYTWSATGLPSPLTINASTGIISGTPTAASTNSVVITVTDSTNPTHLTATLSLTLVVDGALTVTTTTLPTGVTGTAYSQTVAASGGQTSYTWASTALPAGLTLAPSTGIISGTPTAAGTTSVTFTVTDSTNPTHQTATGTISIVILSPVSITTGSLPAGTVGVGYSQMVNATGGTPAYTWSATGLPSPLTINPTTGLISGTPTAASTSSVVVTATDNTSPTHLTATATFSLVILQPLAITTTTVPVGVVGTAYSTTLAGTGGVTPYTWAVTGLPAGMNFNASTGAIGGTPTASGTGTLNITLTDNTNPTHLTVSTTITLTVVNPVSITTSSLPNGTTNTAYNTTVAATGGTTPYVWSATGLPAGYNIAPSTGVISGTTTSANTYQVSITVTDNTNPTHLTATVQLALTVGVPGPAHITPTAGSTPQSANTGAQYANQLQVTVTDASNNPLQGQQVLFTAPSSGASVTLGGFGTQVTLVTNSLGVATAPVATANSIAGTFQVTASVGALSTSFTLSNGVPAPPNGTLAIGNVAVGMNLQTTVAITLPAAAGTGGVPVTITSSDPSKAVIGQGRTTLTVTVPEGQTQQSIVVQGLVSSGTATLTAQSSGYGDGIGTVTLSPSGFVVAGPNDVGASFSTFTNLSTTMTVYPARLTAAGAYAEKQVIRTTLLVPSQADPNVLVPATITVPLTIAPSSGAGTINPTSVTFTTGDTSYNFTYKAPNSTASATMTAQGPGVYGFITPTSGASVNVSVVQSAMTPTTVTVGKNLQTSTNVVLDGAVSGTLQMTITSDDPTKLLLATGPTHAGKSSITVTLPSGAHGSPDYWVLGKQSSGTATYTVSMPGYGQASGTVNLAPSGIIFATGAGATPNPIQTTPGAPATTINVYSAALNGSGGWLAFQWVAGDCVEGGTQNVFDVCGGGSATFNVTTASSTLGSISPTSVTIPAGAGLVTTQYQPNPSNTTAGSTTISVSVPAAPAGFSAPAGGYNTIAVQVSVPGITPTVANGTVIGKDLQLAGGFSLGQAAPAGGLSVTVTATGGLLVAANATDLGATSITFTVPEAGFSSPLYLQSTASSGTGTYTIHANGYKDGTGNVSFAPSGFVMVNNNNLLPFVQVTHGQTVPIKVFPAYLDPSSGAYVNTQSQMALRGGLTLSVTLQTGNTSTATIASPLVVHGGDAPALVTLTGVTAGSTSLTIVQPSGFQAATNAFPQSFDPTSTFPVTVQ